MTYAKFCSNHWLDLSLHLNYKVIYVFLCILYGCGYIRACGGDHEHPGQVKMVPDCTWYDGL